MDCYCDYDPPQFYSVTKPKARKQHRCEECGVAILPGELYERVSGKWDGYVDTFSTCERCHDLRMWVQNNVPCLCFEYGNADEGLEAAIDDACSRAPAETVGLRFGFLRRKVQRNRFNSTRRAV